MDIKIQLLIESFASAMHSEISNIEAKLKQIQTNITDDLKDLINIHIAIYTFAMMSHFILTNYGKVTFAQRLTVDTKPGIVVNDSAGVALEESTATAEAEAEPTAKPTAKPKAKAKVKGKAKAKSGGDADQKELKLRIQNILKNAYYLIIMTKGQVLRRVSNINREKIKQMLMVAYKWVINLKMYKTETDPINTSDLLKTNMIYAYMIYPYVLLNKKPPAISITSKDPFGEITPIEYNLWPKSGNDLYDQYTYKSYTAMFDYLDVSPRTPEAIRAALPSIRWSKLNRFPMIGKLHVMETRAIR
jgi:hypothetical protein